MPIKCIFKLYPFVNNASLEKSTVNFAEYKWHVRQMQPAHINAEVHLWIGHSIFGHSINR